MIASAVMWAPLLLGATFSTPSYSRPPDDGEPQYIRPATADGLRTYMIGAWKLQKAMVYKSGGVSGRFTGSCVFEPLSDAVLRYEEQGEFTRQGSDESVATRNALLYDFSSPNGKVSVFFDAGSDRSSAEAIVAQARFLHSIEPSSLVLADVTVDDADADAKYEGYFEIERPNSFMLTWSMAGTRQEGQILSLFTRQSDKLEGVDLRSWEELIQAEVRDGRLKIYPSE